MKGELRIHHPPTPRLNRAILNSQAFTLLELLIAVVAFAIVLAAINTVFYAALRLRNKSAESFERSRPIEQAMAIIKRDLANIVLPGGTLLGSLQTTSITNTVAGQLSPDFYTSSGLIDQTSPWAEVQKVSYALVQSGKGATGLDLIRVVTRNLLPIAVADQPVQQWLMSGVQGMLFSYYDGNQWRQEWDTTTADPTSGQTNSLPQAIKIQLQLASPETGNALAFSA
ncbi:MAG: prepilin-type N-terminal cleavage/methylation domain-containing protein, partial [Verrucomicrobiales bacterium]|nr:prepilin-type N-terminal cleavage/methylation domain-containing protein [Verrucomicrobiales bacterium]